jgi:hypothetical protein
MFGSAVFGAALVIGWIELFWRHSLWGLELGCLVAVVVALLLR